MVDVTSRLRLVVDSSGVDRGGRRLRDLRREARRAEDQARRLRNAFAGLAGVLGTAFSVQQIKRTVDEYRNIENQLKLVTGSARELKAAQEGVLAVANQTGASLEATARLYANLERFAGDFLDTQRDTLALTQAINQAAAISGASVTEASNAVRQLSQGIAGGILRAEEFNSIVENMPRLAEAIADGLGVGLGELRRQVNSGLVDSEALIRSLQSQFGVLNDEFLNTSRTIGQAATAIGNTLTVEIGQRFQGVQDVTVKALQVIGSNLEDILDILGNITKAAGVAAAAFVTVKAALAGVAFIQTVSSLLALERALGASSLAMAAMGVSAKTIIPSLVALRTAMLAFITSPIGLALAAAGTAFFIFQQRAKTAAENIARDTENIRHTLENMGFDEAVATQRAAAIAELDTFQEAVRDRAQDIARDIAAARSVADGSRSQFGGSGNNITGRGLGSGPTRDDIAQARQQASRELSEQYARMSEDVQKFYDAIAEGIKKVSDAGIKAQNAQLNLLLSGNSLIPEGLENVLGKDAPLLTEAESKRVRQLLEDYQQAAKNAKVYYDILRTDGQAAADAAIQELEARQQIDKLVAELPEAYRDQARAALESARATEMQTEQLREQQRILEEVTKAQLDYFTTQRQQSSSRIVNDAFGTLGQRRGLIDSTADLGFYNDQIDAALEEARNALKNVLIEGGHEFADAMRQVEEDADRLRRDAHDEYLRRQQEIFDHFANTLKGVFSSLLDDLIFEGGDNLGRILENGFRRIINDQVLKPFTDGIFDGKGLGSIRGIFEDIELKFAKAGENLGLSADAAKKFGAASASLSAAFAGGSAGISIGSILRDDANKTNQVLGASIGGAIGTYLAGPLGAAIGSFLGGLTGSLFGKESSKAARGIIGGAGNLIYTENKTNENVGNRNEIATTISELIRTVTELTGATNKAQISFQVGNRDGLSLFRSTGAPGANRYQNANKIISTEDPQEFLSAVFGEIARNLQGGEQALVQFAQAAAAAGQDVESIINGIQKLDAALSLGEQPLSQYAQQLKDLNATIDEAISLAGSATEAERQLLEVRQQVVDQLRRQFNQELFSELYRLQGSPLAGFRDIAAANANTLSDDLALNGSGSISSALRAARFEAFFTSLFQAGQSISDISDMFAEFADIASDAGAELGTLTNGFNAAIAAQKDAFNELIQSDIGNYLNGPLDQLNALLKAQEDRLKTAKSLGADLGEVERLTALELRDFFQGLSDEALSEVEQFLGLFNEATNAVVRNLDLSRQDLRARADAFGQYAQDFSSLNTQFAEQFLAASPRESIDILRERASSLLGQVRDGNESAAQALPQVLQQLVQNARDSFGNTSQFSDVLDFARGLLTEAEQAALGIQSDAERQIAALDENNDILGDIRDILSSGEAIGAFFRSASEGGIASADDILSIIQGGAGLTASNDNATALSVTGLIAQSMQPVIQPLVTSIGQFTQQLSDMPALQELTIDAIDRGADRIVNKLGEIDKRLADIERVEKAQLKELEEAA